MPSLPPPHPRLPGTFSTWRGPSCFGASHQPCHSHQPKAGCSAAQGCSAPGLPCTPRPCLCTLLHGRTSRTQWWSGHQAAAHGGSGEEGTQQQGATPQSREKEVGGTQPVVLEAWRHQVFHHMQYSYIATAGKATSGFRDGILLPTPFDSLPHGTGHAALLPACGSPGTPLTPTLGSRQPCPPCPSPHGPSFQPSGPLPIAERTQHLAARLARCV